MDELVPVFQDLSVEILLDETEHVLQERVEGRLLRPDHRDADPGPLQEVLTVDLGGDDERALALEALRRAAGYLRREVGQRCQLRYAPELHFVADRSLERGARIEELLHQVRPTEPDAADDGGEEPE
ncbi:MAG TPA: 30S ribosome-binding factor RbfA [Thermoanaerobaculia bacterium]|nr:30S ribosome-binding factor RbfA [Thermoanaerobaculia bacterium]